MQWPGVQPSCSVPWSRLQLETSRLAGACSRAQDQAPSLDEAEFLRVMLRTMYLTSAISRPRAAQQESAHVIVSVKRRLQLRRFASYYASRDISGVGHLTSLSKGMTTVKVNSTVATESVAASLGQKDTLSSAQPAMIQSELHSGQQRS
ncbi:hypothetical protein V7S43_018904 [Phytophthora oleae]|uniref:Uncharacterized protein n=1 Tax=Phytophthora oleae TaxID=2107226 RepID=A0ABD3ERG7_9STRA